MRVLYSFSKSMVWYGVVKLDDDVVVAVVVDVSIYLCIYHSSFPVHYCFCYLHRSV